jgi:adenosylcobinamide kinase/adenosylcobinamide-phosphate guanylyltransferase
LAASADGPVVCVATATAGDAEMEARIAAHRERRPPTWRTVEAPLDLDASVAAHAAPGMVMLVDCVSFWVSNEMLRRVGSTGDVDAVPEVAWDRLSDALVAAAEAAIGAARTRQAALVLVSNEVGMGLVPPYPLGRRYRDLLGRVNQAIAARADDVHLLVAGLPLDLRRLRAAGWGRADAG